MATDTTYGRLLALLDGGAARYSIIDHEPEGVTTVASLLRAHPAAWAAKSLVVRVKLSKKRGRYVLAVVPGDRRVDLGRVTAVFRGLGASFAPPFVAERLAGSVSGSIVPFSFHPELRLVVDPALLAYPEIFFNAGRLDRSVALDTHDYLAVSGAWVEPIATPSPPSAGVRRAG